MNNLKTNQWNKYKKWALLLLVPFLFIFDVMVFLTTRSGCIAAGCLNDFFMNSSLTVHIIAQTFPQIRR
jgi:hypothetical protein